MKEIKPTQSQQETTQSKAGVEVQKRVNPDGSYTEIITNHKNNWVEVRKYNAQGKCVNAVYGKLSDD